MKTRKRKTEWWRGVPNQSGTRQYIVLIRDRKDPERKLRGKEQGDVAPHLTMRRTPAEEWAKMIAKHMADGVPRTFNRIAVELLDKTADVVCTTPFLDALWLLVERLELEYTPVAPVYFRRVAT